MVDVPSRKDERLRFWISWFSLLALLLKGQGLGFLELSVIFDASCINEYLETGRERRAQNAGDSVTGVLNFVRIREE